MTLVRTEFKRKAPTTEPKHRTRRCAVKSCRAEFEPRSMTHKCCTPVCAADFAMSERVRKERKERQEGLQKLKRRADYAKEAQAACNAYVRARDAALPCISCGRHHTGQYHAGHYLSRGSHPHLALVEANLAKQCMPCNVHLSGNQLEFRKGLIARIGLEAVEALEGSCAINKFTIDDFKAAKEHYKTKLKQLKGE